MELDLLLGGSDVAACYLIFVLVNSENTMFESVFDSRRVPIYDIYRNFIDDRVSATAM